MQLDDGIDVEPGASGTVIKNNRANRNGLGGIYLGGPRSVVTGNRTEANGVVTSEGTHPNVSIAQFSAGITVESNGNLIQDNTARLNREYGIIVGGSENQIVGNEALYNPSPVDADTRDVEQEVLLGRELPIERFYDLYGNCRGNEWEDNVFITANDPCIR
jgi:parallel beta-helix repeat protein